VKKKQLSYKKFTAKLGETRKQQTKEYTCMSKETATNKTRIHLYEQGDGRVARSVRSNRAVDRHVSNHLRKE
jgi:hypothetical protein